MSLVNILGVVIAAVGVTGLSSLIHRVVESGRLGRDDIEDLDDLPVIDGWVRVAGDLPVVLAAGLTTGDRTRPVTRSSASLLERLLWTLALGCIALGVIQMNGPAVGIGTLGLLLLSGGRLCDAAFRRHTIVVNAQSRRVIGPTYCQSGVAYVDVEGCVHPLSVTVPWRLCRSLVDRYGAVALLVAFDPRHPTRRAYAIGVRAPIAGAVRHEVAPDAVLAPARRARRDTQ